jgi:hypothetical protein
MNLEFINTINPHVIFSRGGLLISAEQESTTKRGFICPNASCGRIFIHPLRAIHEGVSMEPYNACPYCLSELPSDAAPTELVQPKKEQTETERPHTEEQSSLTKSPQCKNYLGFLSQRPPKSPIPDECLTCTVIVQCMLNEEPSVSR